jgi:hypothetical protein
MPTVGPRMQREQGGREVNHGVNGVANTKKRKERLLCFPEVSRIRSGFNVLILEPLQCIVVVIIILVEVFLKKIVSNEPGTTYCAHLLLTSHP